MIKIHDEEITIRKKERSVGLVSSRRSEVGEGAVAFLFLWYQVKVEAQEVNCSFVFLLTVLTAHGNC